MNQLRNIYLKSLKIVTVYSQYILETIILAKNNKSAFDYYYQQHPSLLSLSYKKKIQEIKNIRPTTKGRNLKYFEQNLLA